MGKDIKILISCHKPSQTVKNDLLFPIEVGAALRTEHPEGMLRDDEGINISSKNEMYCELTAQYWAWKNLKSDYYGFFHYRRYLNFNDKKYSTDGWQNVIEDHISDGSISRYGWTEERMRSVIEDYDLIISELKNVQRMPDKNKSVYEQYKNGHSLNIKDLDIVRDIIDERYPEYKSELEEYLRGQYTCLCNMYIMKSELFHNYMEWLFDILFEFEKRMDMSQYTVEGYRTPGHLAERLLTLYYLHLKKQGKYRVKELQTVVIKDTEYKEPIGEIQATAPAFKANNIAIALASNEYFVPYMATTIQSIVANSAKDYNYDILILTSDISAKDKIEIKSQYKDRANISIRYIDPSVLIGDYALYTRGHFSVETYYRLVLPELLLNYDKILYLDSDLVAETDVAQLYEEDIEGYLVAASHDPDTAGLYNGFEPGRKKYSEEVLKLKEPYLYFQAGVLLLNLKEFRKAFSTEEILKFTASREWQLLDQDILNKLCEGRVKYIDMAWNVMTDYKGIRVKQIIAMAPKWLNDLYMDARKAPKIIHYAGPQKPWDMPDMDMGHEFWRYARETSYYEEILVRSTRKWSENEREGRMHKYIKLVGKGIQCIKEHGFRYTINYIIK